MKEKFAFKNPNNWLPGILLVVAALSRWPGLFPSNFSAFYGLAFCAGAFFPGATKWWFPLSTLALTDLALGLYYRSFSYEAFVNYAAFAALIWLGSRFNPRSSLWSLLAGGIFGSALFYLVTNPAAWLSKPFRNPEYSNEVNWWLEPLTPGNPTTLEFFRNTLVSGALFTGIFAGTMKLTMRTRTSQERKPQIEPKTNVARGRHAAPFVEGLSNLGSARPRSPKP